METAQHAESGAARVRPHLDPKQVREPQGALGVIGKKRICDLVRARPGHAVVMVSVPDAGRGKGGPEASSGAYRSFSRL
jgi:hypothetical protein